MAHSGHGNLSKQAMLQAYVGNTAAAGIQVFEIYIVRIIGILCLKLPLVFCIVYHAICAIERQRERLRLTRTDTHSEAPIL